MDLPDLPPDVTFERLEQTKEDIGFAFEVKREALGPYIVQRWRWDEAFQRDIHQRRFDEKPFFRIRQDRQAVGTISVMGARDHIRLGEFYLFLSHQRGGLGTRILRHCLATADGLRMPVHLEYLHWNPVGLLYRRHGFRQIGQSDIHCFMERPCGAPFDPV
jgi:GNAT superfamily N-acetyltransferase